MKQAKWELKFDSDCEETILLRRNRTFDSFVSTEFGFYSTSSNLQQPTLNNQNTEWEAERRQDHWNAKSMTETSSFSLFNFDNWMLSHLQRSVSFMHTQALENSLLCPIRSRAFFVESWQRRIIGQKKLLSSAGKYIKLTGHCKSSKENF